MPVGGVPTFTGSPGSADQVNQIRTLVLITHCSGQDASATHWDTTPQPPGRQVRVCRRWPEGQPPPLQAPLIQGVQVVVLQASELTPGQGRPPQDGAGALQVRVCVPSQGAPQALQALQPPSTGMPQLDELGPEQGRPPHDGAGALQERVCRQAEQMLQGLQPPSTGRQQAMLLGPEQGTPPQEGAGLVQVRGLIPAANFI